ncbi:MAG: 4,4'-diaponeurosporenoate glycosyltransferase [Candidatus Omnitrophica bacterium ADurb.Bin277]|nr:MAG: 4,4'-diaponeurosporenoate glycosyltransferase [Candidatus Omnitrophica bacterium ADurb.Bin277]
MSVRLNNQSGNGLYLIVFLDPQVSFVKIPSVMTPIILIFLAFALSVWIYRGFRSLSELAQAPTLAPDHTSIREGTVSILIPVKNEEKNIAPCIRSLLGQLRENDELIVINNCSTDKTETILRDLGAEEIKSSDGRSRSKRQTLKYINTPPTPDGWTGKNYALHLGGPYASGDWLLFTDADTRHEAGGLDASVSFAEKNSLDLLTLLPRCIARGFWENLIQPCAMGYMGLWFPLRKINSPKAKVYFGNGQYLLIRAEHYQKLGGHAAVREAFLEDFAIMKKTKEAGARGICGFGMKIYGTRMYDSFGAIWRGWRRIYLHAFGQNPGRILKAVLSVLFFSVLPFVLIPAVFSTVPGMIIGGLLVIIILLTAVKTHGIVHAGKATALLHPLAAIVFTATLADAWQMALFNRKTHWR